MPSASIKRCSLACLWTSLMEVLLPLLTYLSSKCVQTLSDKSFSQFYFCLSDQQNGPHAALGSVYVSSVVNSVLQINYLFFLETSHQLINLSVNSLILKLPQNIYCSFLNSFLMNWDLSYWKVHFSPLNFEFPIPTDTDLFLMCHPFQPTLTPRPIFFGPSVMEKYSNSLNTLLLLLSIKDRKESKLSFLRKFQRKILLVCSSSLIAWSSQIKVKTWANFPIVKEKDGVRLSINFILIHPIHLILSTWILESGFYPHRLLETFITQLPWNRTRLFLLYRKGFIREAKWIDEEKRSRWKKQVGQDIQPLSVFLFLFITISAHYTFCIMVFVEVTCLILLSMIKAVKLQ